ncbi:MAG: hypothetical protein ACPLW8_02050 [Candidatus Bathyarchaeales archaeon]
MSWILHERWFWIIALSVIAIFIVPFFIVSFILALPQELRIVATILLIVSWGIVAGYKDWIQSKRKEEEAKK